ncbi:hypothetical protein CRG98_036685 [Punica granatum]|uniref:Uncharacterized protein n=1 Tax=Punica granatum TaxID=22663 RepID=A0A2I0IFX2_PUNGR|nr:hypothetical protein CRG98_036685 [Punica granatum]
MNYDKEDSVMPLSEREIEKLTDSQWLRRLRSRTGVEWKNAALRWAQGPRELATADLMVLFIYASGTATPNAMEGTFKETKKGERGKGREGEAESGVRERSEERIAASLNLRPLCG